MFYGCSAYHRKGKHVCDNALTMPADILEDAVLQAVEAVVLDPSVVQAAVERRWSVSSATAGRPDSPSYATTLTSSTRN